MSRSTKTTKKQKPKSAPSKNKKITKLTKVAKTVKTAKKTPVKKITKPVKTNKIIKKSTVAKTAKNPKSRKTTKTTQRSKVSRVRVVVSGAGGQIGYALLPRILSGQAFGPDVKIDLHLLEVPQALTNVQGVVMELQDCAFPLLNSILVTSDLSEAMRDVNYAVLVGAAPRTQGMERADLLKKNGGIFTDQGRALNDFAARDVKVLVVGNPCNTNALIAMNNAPDLSPQQFFALTMLDQKRAEAQLALRTGVAVTEVTQMAIWGNHSSTQFPDFYHAKIGKKSAPAVVADTTWLQNDFIRSIQQRGAEIIKARGASSALSAANAIAATLYELSHDTAKGAFYSVACHSQGEYGIDSGLIFSFPCRTVKGRIQVVNGLQHDAWAQAKIDLTHNELREERDSVKSLGFIK